MINIVKKELEFDDELKKKIEFIQNEFSSNYSKDDDLER